MDSFHGDSEKWGRWEDCSLTLMAPVPPESRGEMYNVHRADDVVVPVACIAYSPTRNISGMKMNAIPSGPAFLLHSMLWLARLVACEFRLFMETYASHYAPQLLAKCN